MKLDPGNHSSPRPERAHGLATPRPEPVPSDPSLSRCQVGPTCHPSPLAEINAGNRFLPVNSPSSIPFTTLPVSSPSHTYKSPTPPLQFPSFPRARDAARPANLLAGVRHCCGQEPRNPMSADPAALPLLRWNFSPSPELTLMLFLGPNEQQNDLSDAHPKLTATVSPPAVTPRHRRKQSMKPSTPSNSPRRSDPRPHLRLRRRPLEASPASTSGRTSPATTGNPSPSVSSPSLPL
jgi:hypothetical protein